MHKEQRCWWLFFGGQSLNSGYSLWNKVNTFFFSIMMSQSSHELERKRTGFPIFRNPALTLPPLLGPRFFLLSSLSQQLFWMKRQKVPDTTSGAIMRSSSEMGPRGSCQGPSPKGAHLAWKWHSPGRAWSFLGSSGTPRGLVSSMLVP